MIQPAAPSLPPREEVPRAVAELLADLVRRPWREVGARYYLAEYRRTERLSAEALAARQLAGLRRIAWHCFLAVPRHAARIGATLKPADLERLDGPARLPIARVEERRREPGAFVAAGETVALRRFTAGRRGAPQEVLLDAESVARQEAVRMRAEAWAGAKLGAAWGSDRRFYGAAEVGLIASPCERGGMHVHADHLLLEAVDETGRPSAPGERGSLLVTDLHNRAAPYLRHELSDHGRLPGRPCACGRALPLVELDAGA
jgi:phenylacetate-coenzyme A ligase PaaK-like adenylate-forming protein